MIQDTLIKPIDENYIVPPPRRKIGLVAQDVINIIPNAVSEQGNGEYYTLDYNMIIPILINSIKELNEQILELKKQ